MQIMMWTAFFPPHVGGYEKNTSEMAHRLALRGHWVDVVTCNTNKGVPIEHEGKVRVYRLPCVHLLNGRYTMPLPSAMLYHIMTERHKQYDVVSTQTRFFVTSLLGAIYARLHRIPIIHTERGSCHAVVTNPLIDYLGRAFDHTIGHWIMTSAKRVVGISHPACSFSSHIGARDTVRIPNGITIPPPQMDPRNPPVILYVGRLIHAKGVQDLIMAADRLDREHTLAIVGDGPYRATLQKLAGSVGSNSVTFYGELRGDALLDMYRAASVFVNPSYSEGLPTSVMEALAVGVPVVATSVGGTSELVQHMTTGLLVAPGRADELATAIRYMLDNTEAAELMASKGLDNVTRNYSWDTVLDQYCDLLEAVRAP